MTGVDSVIRRAQAGEERAFNELFIRHRGDVARIVFRVLGPTPDAEDVVQDVFIHVFRSIAKFRGESKFSTWLYRLTVNVARMHIRRARSRPRFADVAVPEKPRDELSENQSPDRAVDRAQRIRALYALVDQLSEKKRTVLVLHDFEGVSAKDISEIVEAPVLTVRTRLFYARKELYATISQDPSLQSVASDLMDALPGRPKTDESEKREPSQRKTHLRESRP